MNVQQFWSDVLAQRADEIREYFHADAYVIWHCSNEHFTVEEFIRANCEYPGDWDDVVEQMHMMPASSIEDAIAKAKKILAKEDPSITAIPDGISVIVTWRFLSCCYKNNKSEDQFYGLLKFFGEPLTFCGSCDTLI